VLIDCGCSDIVMSSDFARQLGFSLRSDMSLEPVTLANGSKQPVTWTTQAVPFSVGSAYTEHLHFSVTDVTYDVILGLPWLESGNKSVDWSRRTISFVHAGQVVTLEAGKPSKRAFKKEFGDRLLNSVQIKKILKKKQPVFQVVPNVTPETSDHRAPEWEKCEQLKAEFPDIFPQDLSGHLPPDRGMPFKIETEPGAIPVNRPIYRLSPSELEELRRTLDDLLAKGFIRPSNSPLGGPRSLRPQEGRGLAILHRPPGAEQTNG
jgi:hypothetical protein